MRIMRVNSWKAALPPGDLPRAWRGLSRSALTLRWPAMVHTFVGSALSPPTGRNTPHQCPACHGVSVRCEGCGNIIPMCRAWRVAGADELERIDRPMAAWAAGSVGQGDARVRGADTLRPELRHGRRGLERTAGVGWGRQPAHGGDWTSGGHEIMGNVSCGRFSGLWWDGQAGELAAAWRKFPG